MRAHPLNLQNIKKKMLPNTNRENINKKGVISSKAIFTAIKALDHSIIANIKQTQPFKPLIVNFISFILVSTVIDDKTSIQSKFVTSCTALPNPI